MCLFSPGLFFSLHPYYLRLLQALAYLHCIVDTAFFDGSRIEALRDQGQSVVCLIEEAISTFPCTAHVRVSQHNSIPAEIRALAWLFRTLLSYASAAGIITSTTEGKRKKKSSRMIP